MLDRPNFKSCYHVESIDPDMVLFLSEREVSWLDDRLCYAIASLVDGDRTTDEIFELLQQQLVQGQISAEEARIEFQTVFEISMKIQRSLFQMERQGYLVEKSLALSSQATIFCNHTKIAIPFSNPGNCFGICGGFGKWGKILIFGNSNNESVSSHKRDRAIK